MLNRALLAAGVLVAPFAVAACSAAADANSPAAKTAALFVTLDTLGDREAADTLVFACDDDPSDGQITPVSFVSLRAPVPKPHTDTTLVEVHYEVLGTAHPEDGNVVGPKYWRFTAAPRIDTVELRLAPDSTGRMWIACGSTKPTHVMLSEIGEAVKLMDSASLAELELAKVGKKPAAPDSQ